jgi:hypothetical protein
MVPILSFYHFFILILFVLLSYTTSAPTFIPPPQFIAKVSTIGKKIIVSNPAYTAYLKDPLWFALSYEVLYV